MNMLMPEETTNAPVLLFVYEWVVAAIFDRTCEPMAGQGQLRS